MSVCVHLIVCVYVCLCLSVYLSLCFVMIKHLKKIKPVYTFGER